MSDLKFHQRSGVQLEMEGWMNIATPELSVEDAQAQLVSLGNTILEVDELGRRFRVLHETMEEFTAWVCDKCGAYSRSYQVALNHEQECDGAA